MFSYTYRSIDFAHKLDKTPKAAPDFEEHFHDFYELFFFISGNALYHVEEEYHLLTHGDVLLIQPGKHHYVTFKDLTPYERYVLKFPSYLLPDYLKEKFIGRSAFFLKAKILLPLFMRLDKYYNMYDGEDLYTLFSQNAVEILINLSHYFPNTKPLVTNNRITPILQYINSNLNLPLTINDLCEKFYCSQSYICKQFRAYMKVPIMKYIRTKKIMAAHNQILQGKSPTKVAEMFGYSDYSTFYRSYIAVIGSSPSSKNEKPEH